MPRCVSFRVFVFLCERKDEAVQCTTKPIDLEPLGTLSIQKTQVTKTTELGTFLLPTAKHKG